MVSLNILNLCDFSEEVECLTSNSKDTTGSAIEAFAQGDGEIYILLIFPSATLLPLVMIWLLYQFRRDLFYRLCLIVMQCILKFCVLLEDDYSDISISPGSSPVSPPSSLSTPQSSFHSTILKRPFNDSSDDKDDDDDDKDDDGISQTSLESNYDTDVSLIMRLIRLQEQEEEEEDQSVTSTPETLVPYSCNSLSSSEFQPMTAEPSSELSKSDSRSTLQINHISSDSVPGTHSSDQEISVSKHDDNSISTQSSGGLETDNVIIDQVGEVSIHEDNSTGLDNSSEIDSANQGTDQGGGVSIHSTRSEDAVNSSMSHSEIETRDQGVQASLTMSSDTIPYSWTINSDKHSNYSSSSSNSSSDQDLFTEHVTEDDTLISIESIQSSNQDERPYLTTRSGKVYYKGI